MKTKELERQIRLAAVRRLPAVLGALPESWGREFCALVGLAAYAAIGRDRRIALANLSRVHPDWPPERTQRAARRVFVELGRNVYDFLRYPGLGSARRASLVRLHGQEHLDGLRSRGRGAILVSAHWGCFEILGAALRRFGYPVRALARPLREPALDAVLAAHRRRMGVDTLSTGESLLRPARFVQRGGFLGVLADQRVREGGVPLRFLGQETRWTGTPARLALATGAPLVPLGIHRLADHSHRVDALPPVAPPSRRGEIADVTRRIAADLEALLLEAPEQWMWMHPRWGKPARPWVISAVDPGLRPQDPSSAMPRPITPFEEPGHA
jgi:KDO2-lipid IV(A) lauroyltransferase